MANVRFSLKHPNDNTKESLVSLVYRFNGKKLVYSTSLKSFPKDFNSKTHRFKRSYQDYQLSNEWLDKMEAETKKAHHHFRNENINPTVQNFKDYLNIFTNKVQVTDETNLLSFIKKIIEERKKDSKYREGSIKVYDTFYKHLKGYSDSKKVKLSFDSIDYDFYDMFTKYLYKKDFSKNYVAKNITVLKIFMNEALERELTTNTKFKSKMYSTKQTEAENVYLSEKELEHLYYYDLSNHKRLERVRDLFLIASYTGLRYSDFSNIRKENIKNIDGVDMIEITTIKTNEKVIIPIHPFVQAIFNKYGGTTPRVISNQRLNDYIKELCQKVGGFDQDIIIKRTNGNKEKTEVKKKYELISSHTARRSFATNAFKAGVSSISIMKITGHKTETSFLRYIKVSKEENALLMAKHAFFQNKRILKAI